MITNLTPESVLRDKAERWIEANGLPSIALVESAIRHSELAGDPFSDNPFRRVLLDVAAERGASRYGNGPRATREAARVR